MTINMAEDAPLCAKSTLQDPKHYRRQPHNTKLTITGPHQC